MGRWSHGNSWKQQCRDLHRLFTAAKRKPSWTSGSDLGQWSSPPRRSDSCYLATPDLHLRLVALPAYSPDFNADEAVWDWAREEVTANECLGTKAQVQEKMNAFFDRLTHRKDEVRPLPNTVTGQSRRIDVYTCRAFAIAPKCSSHLGFGLGVGEVC